MGPWSSAASGGAGLEAAERLGKPPELGGGVRTGRGERRGEADAPPGLHDGHEEGRARLRVVLEREHVLAHAPVVPMAPPDLLPPRPARLALGALAPRPP